jgi:hypothetical protein
LIYFYALGYSYRLYPPLFDPLCQQVLLLPRILRSLSQLLNTVVINGLFKFTCSLFIRTSLSRVTVRSLGTFSLLYLLIVGPYRLYPPYSTLFSKSRLVRNFGSPFIQSVLLNNAVDHIGLSQRHPPSKPHHKLRAYSGVNEAHKQLLLLTTYSSTTNYLSNLTNTLAHQPPTAHKWEVT